MNYLRLAAKDELARWYGISLLNWPPEAIKKAIEVMEEHLLKSEGLEKIIERYEND